FGDGRQKQGKTEKSVSHAWHEAAERPRLRRIDGHVAATPTDPCLSAHAVAAARQRLSISPQLLPLHGDLHCLPRTAEGYLARHQTDLEVPPISSGGIRSTSPAPWTNPPGRWCDKASAGRPR